MSKFVLIFLGVLTIMVMFDPGLRQTFGLAVGAVMYPAIGFQGSMPLVTLLLAGIIMSVFSTVVRHFLVDWIEMAMTQKIVSAFQKERLDALKKNNQGKLKKLNEQQGYIMGLNMKNMKSQMKAMALTMLIIISVFAWLYVFLDGLQSKTFTVPWATNVSFMEMTVLPNWILVYSLFSIPFAQLIARMLKHLTFSRKLARGI